MSIEQSDRDIVNSLYLDGAFSTSESLPGFWSGGSAHKNGLNMINIASRSDGNLNVLELTPGGLVVAGMAIGHAARMADVISLLGGETNTQYAELMSEASHWYARSANGSEIVVHVAGASPSGVFRREELPQILANPEITTVYSVHDLNKGKYGHTISVATVDEWYYPQRHEWLKCVVDNTLAEHPERDYQRYLKSLSRLVIEASAANLSRSDAGSNLHWNQKSESELYENAIDVLRRPLSPTRHIDYAHDALEYIRNQEIRKEAEEFLHTV